MDWAERSRGLAALAALLLLIGVAAPAAAERVKMEVTLVYVSDKPGGVGIGARARRFDALLPDVTRLVACRFSCCMGVLLETIR